jgi:PAS domain S-box-containing protein
MTTDRQVPTHGSAEATTMATAFNEMTSHLRHWHEQAEERARRLETSYERFHSVTESARDGIVSTNAQGSITFWNRSAAAILGYDEADALGTSFFSIAESDRPLYLEALAAGSARRAPFRDGGDRCAKERQPVPDGAVPVHRTHRRHLRDGGAPVFPNRRNRRAPQYETIGGGKWTIGLLAGGAPRPTPLDGDSGLQRLVLMNLTRITSAAATSTRFSRRRTGRRRSPASCSPSSADRFSRRKCSHSTRCLRERRSCCAG